MKFRIPAVLLALSLAASAFAADYVADIRFGPSDGDVITLSFDENREIHKASDATMRYPVAFGDGQPVEYDECGLGLSVDLTEFECDGKNVRFMCDLEMRELAGWKTYQEWRMPVISSRDFYSIPHTGKLGEWIGFPSCGSDDTGLRYSLRIRKADSPPEGGAK